MTTSQISTAKCRQCQSELPVEQDSANVVCAFCGTTNYVDKSQAVFHYVVRTTVRETDAQAALRRWMAGNATVKDLDKKATIESLSYELFPLWMVRTRETGAEKVFLEPAAAISVTEILEITIPAADLEPYDGTFADIAIDPTVPLDTVRKWMKEQHNIDDVSVSAASLVHLPIYIAKYNYNGERYTAVIDAASSRVFANIYPSKWEAPYFTIGAIAFALNFCAALIPVVSWQTGTFSLGLSILIYLAAVVVLAIPVFIVAAVISAKV